MTGPPSRTLVLVDGTNIAHALAWTGSAAPRAGGGRRAAVEDAARRLVDASVGWAARADVDVLVTFDGAGPFGAGELRCSPSAVVVGTGSRDADSVLEDHASATCRSGGRWWLVTSDRALREVAGAGADRVLGARAWLREIGLDGEGPSAPPEELRGTDAPGTAGSSSVRASLDDEVRARLERLRRGR